MEVQLRRLGPNSKVKILKVPKESKVKIWLAGRGTNCEIYTKSKYASRQHFSITYREQKYYISDLGSSNGTFLNDEKVVGEKMLNFGNIISVGVPSEMQNSPDCIVYVFELHSGMLSTEKCLSLSEKDKTVEVEKNLNLREVLEQNNINTRLVDEQPTDTNKQLNTEFLDVNKNNEKTDLSDSSSCDVVLIESFNEPKPAKVKKLGESETVLTIGHEEGQTEVEMKESESSTVVKEINSEDEDSLAYKAPTQIDEPQVKTDAEFLNYSITEELIEISDQEDDWSANVKVEESKLPGEDEEDDDDDVVIIKTICHSKDSVKNDFPLDCHHYGLKDGLSEVDIKWMEKLLKKEPKFLEEYDETREGIELGDEQEEIVMVSDEEEETAMEVDEQEETVMVVDEPKVKDSEDSSVGANDLSISSGLRLSKQPEHDIPDQTSELKPKTFPEVEVPRKPNKEVVPKKSVSFDMNPRIKYFNVPYRRRQTDSEKGRARFARIIFNICSWNTHWLEECKRVAPDKFPPDICEEPLRKIPKKFTSHSVYMMSFIPAMLHHLWSTIKNKWLNSEGSGFRQMVSCDSIENYQYENLTTFVCTGLVQDVTAHKQLIREEHLVLLRLHQIRNSQYITPGAKKYSRKLGYLVFGFVQSRTYERYHCQPLHRSLAERCAAVVGDKHIVRITILVKKRPNFQIDKKKLIQLTAVQSISREMRSFRGVCFLPDSPLCSAILKPSNSRLPAIEPGKNETLIFKGPVDDCQREIIMKLSHAFLSNDSCLYNIHGPAGTGKGQVIIGLIFQLLYSDEWKSKRPKIIYCTQWSIPLDEMVVKLKSFRQTAEEPFNLVRVGPIREVKPEVRDLCVSNLASSLRRSDKRVLSDLSFDAEIEVIKKADVICTTCITAGTSKMCAAFGNLVVNDKNQKIICIIDEAMSSKEAYAVVPLLLNVTHLLLVGDLYQMEPSSSGEKINSLGLDVSLFWRIYKNFINIPKDSWPIYNLKTQYRMNPSLSNFTGQLIYNTPLENPVSSFTNRIKNIRSHLLFVNQVFVSVKDESSIENQEVRTVSRLMKAIIKVTKASAKNVNFSFAIIACDSKHCEYLQCHLPKREFPEVEINQIQAFQGREFDVVTFVYDGKKILPSRLATALTRARSSLFIFASEKSIDGSSFFEKMSINAVNDDILRYVNAYTTVEDFEGMIKAS